MLAAVVLVAAADVFAQTDGAPLELAAMRVPPSESASTALAAPTTATLTARERPRVHFEIAGSIGVALSSYLGSGSIGITSSLGVQVNDRWALYARGALHSVFFMGNFHGAVFAEHNIAGSILSLGFGAGAQHSYLLAGPPCAGCVLPWELSVIVPMELSLDPIERSPTQIERRGIRISFEGAPTFSIRGQTNNSPSLLGGYLCFRVGWALR